MLNKCMLIGRLGKEPELRFTPNGNEVCTFSIATSEKRKVDNEWKEYTEWHRIVTWKTTAKNCGEYLTKGSLVYIEGQIRTRSWEDKQGDKKYVTEIHAFLVKFLDGTKTKSAGGGASHSDEEDIPF
jgi:single-strand DNA-binding protein